MYLRQGSMAFTDNTPMCMYVPQLGSILVFRFSSRRKMFSILFSYLFHGNVGSGGLPLEKIPESNCLQRQKFPYHNLGDGNGHEHEEKEFCIKEISCPLFPHGRGQMGKLPLLPPA